MARNLGRFDEMGTVPIWILQELWHSPGVCVFPGRSILGMDGPSGERLLPVYFSCGSFAIALGEAIFRRRVISRVGYFLSWNIVAESTIGRSDLLRLRSYKKNHVVETVDIRS